MRGAITRHKNTQIFSEGYHKPGNKFQIGKYYIHLGHICSLNGIWVKEPGKFSNRFFPAKITTPRGNILYVQPIFEKKYLLTFP